MLMVFALAKVSSEFQVEYLSDPYGKAVVELDGESIAQLFGELELNLDREFM